MAQAGVILMQRATSPVYNPRHPSSATMARKIATVLDIGREEFVAVTAEIVEL